MVGRPSGGAKLQFLRELHFIEAKEYDDDNDDTDLLQFLRELHFIEARCC
mgnify:CR=1 FL=1